MQSSKSSAIALMDSVIESRGFVQYSVQAKPLQNLLLLSVIENTNSVHARLSEQHELRCGTATYLRELSLETTYMLLAAVKLCLQARQLVRVGQLLVRLVLKLRRETPIGIKGL